MQKIQCKQHLRCSDDSINSEISEESDQIYDNLIMMRLLLLLLYLFQLLHSIYAVVNYTSSHTVQHENDTTCH